MGKRELINSLIANIDGGREVAAAYLGLSMSAFNDRLYENKGTKFFSVDDLLALQKLSGTALVAKYFAKEAGYFVGAIPSNDIDKEEIHMMALRLPERKGQLHRVIIESIKNGGSIDSEEEKIILKEFREYISFLDLYVRSNIELYKKAKL